MAKGLAVVSGGMDSVTLAYMLAEHDNVDLISFYYGQKHKKEVEFARRCAEDIGADHFVVDLSSLGRDLRSALTTSDNAVPDGHYAEESMKQTVVPNRNSIMLNIAAGIAISGEYDYIATGVHAGDHFIYPDCRPVFINSLNQLLKVANEGFIKPNFQVQAPYIHMGKDGIVTVGCNLDTPVDYTKTWSCYKGGELHCGTCGTCTERKEAFQLAGQTDPTQYEA